jgi:Transposase DNA-binding
MREQGHEGWAREEFGAAFFRDKRHLDRLVSMAASLVHRPAGTVLAAFPERADAKGAYAWLENHEIEPEDVARAQQVACARRCTGEDYLVVPIDGSSWTFTDSKGIKGLGRIGTHTNGALGLKTMTAYGLNPAGTPLGVLGQALWVRPLEPNPIPHEKRPLEEKESRWWSHLMNECAEIVRQYAPKTSLWFQLDREADQVSVLLCDALRLGHDLTVRVEDNRQLAAFFLIGGKVTESKLFEALDTLVAAGTASVALRATPKRKARTARVEVSFGSVSLRLREQYTKRLLSDEGVWVVRVRELPGSCPCGEEPLEWLLYTTRPVSTFADAMLVVRNYALRWRIERLFFATKSGACQTEHSQLESLQAAKKWATLMTSVAARFEHILHRSRNEPEVSAEEEFSRYEIDGTLALLASVKVKSGYALGQSPTLNEMVGFIARLGGYWGKSSGGPPGVKTFTRGMERVEAAAAVFAAIKQGELLPQGGRDPGKA